MNAIQERRREPRCEGSGFAVVGGREVDLVDFSLSGLCVADSQGAPVGRELPFQVQFRGGDRVHGTARVRWSEPMGMRRGYGLEIERIGPVARQRLIQRLRPHHFGFFQLAGLAAEFGCAAVAILAFRELLFREPRLMAQLTEALPYLLGASGLLLLPYLLLRRS